MRVHLKDCPAAWLLLLVLYPIICKSISFNVFLHNVSPFFVGEDGVLKLKRALNVVLIYMLGWHVSKSFLWSKLLCTKICTNKFACQMGNLFQFFCFYGLDIKPLLACSLETSKWGVWTLNFAEQLPIQVSFVAVCLRPDNSWHTNVEGNVTYPKV